MRLQQHQRQPNDYGWEVSAQQKGQGLDRLAVCKARYALVPYLKSRRVDREAQESSSSEGRSVLERSLVLAPRLPPKINLSEASYVPAPS